MTIREQDLIRYALSYLAFGDGRVARGWTAESLTPATMKEIRTMVKELSHTMGIEVEVAA